MIRNNIFSRFFVSRKKYDELLKKHEDFKNGKIKILYELVAPERLRELDEENDRLKVQNSKLKKEIEELEKYREIKLYLSKIYKLMKEE